MKKHTEITNNMFPRGKGSNEGWIKTESSHRIFWQVTGAVAAAAVMAVLLVCSVLVRPTNALLTDSTEPVDNVFSVQYKYTLKYHSNAPGEDVKVPDTQTEYGDGNEEVTFDISPEKPLRNGFVFTGWNTKEDGKGEPIDPDSEYKTAERHTDLYAQWKAGYTLIYDPNGGKDAPAADTQVSNEANHTFDIKGKGQMKYEFSAKDDDDNEVTKEKIFLGWADTPNAIVPSYNDSGKYDYQGDDFDTEKYGNNKSAVLKEDVTLNNPVRTKILYAVWAIRYSLTYNLNSNLSGCSGPLPSSQSFVTLDQQHRFDLPKKEDAENITPKRDSGYKWGWWGTPENNFYEKDGYHFGEYIDLTDEKPDVNLYALFQPPGPILVTFHYNISGTVENKLERNPFSEYRLEEHFSRIPIEEKTPTIEWYKFMGWSEDKNAKEPDPKYDPGKEFVMNIVQNNKMNLYAVWKPYHKYRLQFSYSGGSGRVVKDTDGIKTTSSNYSFDSHDLDYPVSNPNAAEYRRYTLANEYTWTNSGDWKGQKIKMSAERNNDETGSYRFKGWSFKNQANGATITDDDIIKVDKDGYLEDISVQHPASSCSGHSIHTYYLYPVWERSPLHTYKVVFTRNPGNSNNDESVEKATSSDPAVNALISGSESGKVVSVKKDSGGGEISVNSPSGSVHSSGPLGVQESASYEWNAAYWQGLTKYPKATKRTTDTESYEFIGWSYEPNAASPDITVDSNGAFTDSIKINEPDNTCDGAKHYLVLFPVFKKVPHHKFNLYFEMNLPSSGVTSYFRYKSTSGSWTYSGGSSGTIKDTEGKEHKLSKYKIYSTENLSIKSDKFYEWTYADFWKNNGIYATASTAAEQITFRGWSTTKWAPDDPNKTVEYPVTSPAGSTPQGDEGLITETIRIDEPTSGDNHCTEDAGKVHNKVLYGVWDYQPLHSYELIFSGNSTAKDGDTAYIYYKNNNSWTYTSGSTLNNVKTVSGETVSGITNGWRGITSPTSLISDPSAREYTWSADGFWNTKGVYATRKASETTRYEFLGWSHDKDAASPETRLKADFKDEGGTQRSYISSDITINDPHTAVGDDKCTSGEVHTDILYAIWKPIKIHTYNVKFDSNGGNNISYYDKGSNSWKSNGRVHTYSYGPVDVEAGKNSHTWSAGDIGAKATKNQDNNYTYEFMGWSTEQHNPSENPADPDVNVNDDGLLTDDVTAQCEETPCQGGNHAGRTYYAVWKAVPREKSFKLTFDGNAEGVTGVPQSMNGTERYNGSKWDNKYEFDIPTNVPVNRELLFVGWDEDKNATLGTYGHAVPGSESYDLVKDLESKYIMTIGSSSFSIEKKLFAIWWYQYKLEYHANGGNHGPAHEQVYANGPETIFEISEVVPQRDGYRFLGWSHDSNATVPQYINKGGTGYPDSFKQVADESGKTTTDLYAVWEKI